MMSIPASKPQESLAVTDAFALRQERPKDNEI